MHCSLGQSVLFAHRSSQLTQSARRPSPLKMKSGGSLLIAMAVLCGISSSRARCWHRFPDQSWSLVESIAAADTGPVLYLGTFVTAGECAVACRAYSHMDTRCTAFTFFHFDDTTRALQCLGAVEGSLESHKATTAALSPSHAISAVFQVIVLVSF